MSRLIGHDRLIHLVTFLSIDWEDCGYGKAACGVDATHEHYYPVASFPLLPIDGECPACSPSPAVTDPRP